MQKLQELKFYCPLTIRREPDYDEEYDFSEEYPEIPSSLRLLFPAISTHTPTWGVILKLSARRVNVIKIRKNKIVTGID